MQKLQDYPITTITNTKHSKRKDKFGTTKMFISYKCTWAQPKNQNYTMWLATDKVFPHNKPNITNHNLTLLKQFYLTQQHKHYFNIIAKNFHQPQSKDTRCVHGPLNLLLIQINLHECKLDKDIKTTQSTIQIIGDEAHIFTDIGNLLITIPKIRLEWLRKQYNTNLDTQHQLDPQRQSFIIEIIWLYERYKYRIPKTNPLKNSQYTLPSKILDLLIETFKITTSYFSSPVTCSTMINTFYSPFQRDSIFGSKGQAYSHKWQNIGYAHPHNTENTHKAIHWARLTTQENQNTITILTIPNEEWTTNDTPYKTKFDDTHVSIHFLLDTIIYKEPTIPPELNKEPRKETLAIRILCIHHQNTEINLADLETKLLQITTNLNINPLYIKAPPPTPLNVKVHKHPKWNKMPYPINRNQNTSLQLPNFPQNQHQKFPPQFCYYTDG
jgi:hypothetical protein